MYLVRSGCWSKFPVSEGSADEEREYLYRANEAARIASVA